MDIKTNFMDNILLGNTLNQWIISLSIVAGAALLCWIISLSSKSVMGKCPTKRQHFVKLTVAALKKPVIFGIIMAAVYFALIRLNINASTIATIEKIYSLLAILNVTWAIAKFANILIEKFQEQKHFDNKLLPLLKRAILIVIWVIGIITALNNAGIKVTTLLGALGVSGIAAALAAQDTLKNIFGGVTIFMDGHLHIGDHVQFDAYEGVIQDINLRSTRIKTFEDRVVTVPNYKLMDASVINVSTEARRRVLIKIGLTYNTLPEKMKEAIEILKSIPQNISEIDSDTIAVFSDFGDSALIITYIYYIKKPSDIRESTSKVNFTILECFNSAGLDFAFPTQTVYIGK
ncbi:MAG: mechanosensitive ion channel family protein [Prevotellaceae bacterium]|jgi:MscS family membrane protein|nr:mechanosensitive ion channel family protein [Prevotellaceae bacterium]